MNYLLILNKSQLTLLNIIKYYLFEIFQLNIKTKKKIEIAIIIFIKDIYET